MPTSVSAAPTIATLFLSESTDPSTSIRWKAEDARDIVMHHLARIVLGYVGEVERNFPARVRPYALRMRIVGAPHEIVDADHVARQHACAIIFEGREELAAKIKARSLGQLRLHPTAIVVPPMVHELHDRRDPSD